MWKKYDDEFKRNAMQKVFDGQSVRSVAEELGVNESLIHKWKRAALTKGDGNRSGTEVSEIFSYIEGYYNRVRLHSSLDYKSPIEFEMELQTKNGGNKRQFFV